MTKFFENLIKLTDYPFSYSFIPLLILILSNKKFDIFQVEFQEIWPFFVIIGIFGTLLTTIDPLGTLIRFLLGSYKKERIEIFLSENRYRMFSLLRKFRRLSSEKPHSPTEQIPKKQRIKIFFFKIKYWLLSPFRKLQDWAFTRPYQESDLDHFLTEHHNISYYREKEYNKKIVTTKWISYEIEIVVSTLIFFLLYYL